MRITKSETKRGLRFLSETRNHRATIENVICRNRRSEGAGGRCPGAPVRKLGVKCEFLLKNRKRRIERLGLKQATSSGRRYSRLSASIYLLRQTSRKPLGSGNWTLTYSVCCLEYISINISQEYCLQLLCISYIRRPIRRLLFATRQSVSQPITPSDGSFFKAKLRKFSWSSRQVVRLRTDLQILLSSLVRRGCEALQGFLSPITSR